MVVLGTEMALELARAAVSIMVEPVKAVRWSSALEAVIASGVCEAGANLQGLGRGQLGAQGMGGEAVRVQQVMGAVPRSVRTVRRGPNPPPSP